MPAIGLIEAARLTGKNVSTIHRAMKTGRLSYTRNDAGVRLVEVAELERVFGIKGGSKLPFFDGNGASPSSDASPLQSHSVQSGEIAVLRELIERQDATIADLRASIRAITEEKRTLLALLTAPNRVPWWRRWFK